MTQGLASFVLCPLFRYFCTHADCSTCLEGYSPGIGYICRRCSGGIGSIIVTVTILVSAVAVALLVLFFWIHDKSTGGGQGLLTSMRRQLLSLKIVIIVWQVTTQVKTNDRRNESDSTPERHLLIRPTKEPKIWISCIAAVCKVLRGRKHIFVSRKTDGDAEHRNDKVAELASYLDNILVRHARALLDIVQRKYDAVISR